MRNRTYGGVRGRKTKVGRKLLRFPPTRFMVSEYKKPALFAPLVEPVEILTMPENGAREGESKSLPRGEGFREGVTFTR